MNRNDCEAVLHLHRTFLPRRRTGRGFLTGTVFLDAALLFGAFVLATSLPAVPAAVGIQYNDMVLGISREGLFFFNDEKVSKDDLQSVLAAAAQERPGIALILEADAITPQSSTAAVYDAAARAGFRKVFIATRNVPMTAPASPAP